jgi:hypothetical protein
LFSSVKVVKINTWKMIALEMETQQTSFGELEERTSLMNKVEDLMSDEEKDPRVALVTYLYKYHNSVKNLISKEHAADARNLLINRIYQGDRK